MVIYIIKTKKSNEIRIIQNIFILSLLFIGSNKFLASLQLLLGEIFEFEFKIKFKIVNIKIKICDISPVHCQRSP